MEVIQTGIEGLIEIQPKVFYDNRGYFFESYSKKDFAKIGITCDFCQDNISKSTYGVIRGLHFQRPPYSQAKLASAAYGKILDVAVDLRANSPTYGQWRSVILDSEKHNMFFIPRGFAHGIAILSSEAIFSYHCDNPYHPESEDGIAYDDPDLNIDWMIKKKDMVLSDKDKHRVTFKNYTQNVTK